MNEKLFFVDESVKIFYSSLLRDIANLAELPKIIYEKKTYQIFLYIYASIVNDCPIIILDSDFSDNEIVSLGVNQNELEKKFVLSKNSTLIGIDLKKQSENLRDWKISLFTSGTTGLPKKVTHSFSSIARMIKISEKISNNVWGFAYNPTHIAGLQVYLQALLNQNTIVNLFGKTRKQIFELINKYKISNISATPTFYRMLLPVEISFPSVTRITSGGEKFDIKLVSELEKLFPNAKFLNLYASTEAGTILAAKDDYFEIPKENYDKIKIIDSELVIHKSLLGVSETFNLNDGWYCTNDLVELVSENPIRFKFIKRKNEMVNIGGYKVNPQEIEDKLNQHNAIDLSRVYGKKNSVLGNILIAEVKLNSKTSVSEIQEYLRKFLQEYKIPRIINFVENIELTRTGKIKRQ